ncbi:MAG: hypothetical protein Q8M99_11770 [Methylotenera sp.]|nr:hypothetical protein [Methylotenera sp.]
MLVHDEFDMPVVKSKEQRAAEVRAAMPECSAMVDEIRALFGDVVVLSMAEGDKEIKPKNYKSDNDYSMWIGADRYFELGKLSEKAFEAANGKIKNATRK